jgi:hypothetical protein
MRVAVSHAGTRRGGEDLAPQGRRTPRAAAPRGRRTLRPQPARGRTPRAADPAGGGPAAAARAGCGQNAAAEPASAHPFGGTASKGFPTLPAAEHPPDWGRGHGVRTRR